MKVTLIPVVIRALRTVFKNLEKRLSKLKLRGRIKTIQTAAHKIS